MPFSSLFFLHVFLPVFLLAYWLAPRRYANLTALVGSLLFYAWGAPQFLPVLCVLALVDYQLGHAIARWREHELTRGRAKAALTAGICMHLGMLAYFKYSNFFVGEVNRAIGRVGHASIAWTQVVLPIGISFITFEEVSYLTDVYRGDAKPPAKFTHYALFLTLFPHAIAGPIFRWKDLQSQLMDRSASRVSIQRGFERFAMGLGKKVLLADSVAIIADNCFNYLPASQLSPGLAWSAAVAYTLQIYFDFSGYSDMAIGLGAMMGFRFKENFRQPYLASTLTEFWQRWHISLSSWLRDYLYVPLGGNRRSPRRALLNVFLVFAISGLWHGPAWTFVAWGAFHGIVVVLERRFVSLRARVPAGLGHALTLLLVVCGWVFFRANSLGQAWAFLRAMVGFRAAESLGILPAFIFPRVALLAGAVGLAVALLPRWWPAARMASAADEANTAELSATSKYAALRAGGCVVLLLASSVHMVCSGTTPLIYFKF